MPSAFQARGLVIRSIVLYVLGVGLMGPAMAQPVGTWNAPVAMMYSPGGTYSRPYGGVMMGEQVARPPEVPQRGPLARLVRNGDATAGLPPFALADQAGVIQRYVEPVPGVDLDAHVGSVVVVRHDTGRTLLASQLELPALPPHRRVGDDMPATRPARHQRRARAPRSASDVRRAQYVDDDDSTVELLTEDPQPLDNSRPLHDTSSLGPEEEAESSEATIEAIPDRANVDEPHYGTEFDGETWSEELPPGAGPSFAPSFAPSFPGPMEGNGVYTDCPECYGEEYYDCPHCHGDPMMGGGMMGGPADMLGLRNGRSTARQCEFFADVQFNFLRLHLMEGAVGKLSESYQLSPRFILGFEGGEISDGRVRYWTYGRDTERLSGGRVRFEMDVLDIEATQRFQIKRSDIVVGAGLRLAAINVEDVDEDEIGADLVGMTVAADAHTHICNLQQGRLAWVFGGRLSLLGGDWGGDENNDLVEVPVQDDNVVTDELFGGIEYSCRYRRVDLRARLAFEMQNWHSDVFAQQAGTDSIGFLGPGVHVGAQF